MISPRFARCRITKIRCPSCEGTGGGPLGGCRWCNGERRMKVSKVDHWSKWIWIIAGGGFIDGSHDLNDMREMEAKANAARALAGLKPLK